MDHLPPNPRLPGDTLIAATSSSQTTRPLISSTRKMCGIHAVISTSFEHGMSSDLKRCLTNRGPDHNDAVQARISGNDQDLFLTLSSTVLSLRGDHVAEQPLIDDSSGSVLCWNGEAWAIRGESVQGNDGEAVLALLIEASRSAATDGVLEALRMIEGPFAFVYFDKQAKRIYYGRDRLGRRSLLIKTGIPFALSSIVETPVDGWSEVEADGCYTIHLEEVLATDIVPVRHDWNSDISLVSLPKPLSPGKPATYSGRSQASACSTQRCRNHNLG